MSCQVRGHPVFTLLFKHSQPGPWVCHILFMCCISMQAQVICKSRLLLLALIFNLLLLTSESWTGSRHKLAKSDQGNLKSCRLVRAEPSLALAQPRALPQALPKQARAVQKAQDQLPKQARAVQLPQLLPGQAPKRSALARGSMRPPKQLPMHLQVNVVPVNVIILYTHQVRLHCL